MTNNDRSSWRGQLYGCVDDVTAKHARGWLVGPADLFPVRVALFLDEVQVRTAWADQESSANTVDAAASFSMPLSGIWDFCQKSTRVSVRVDGTPIPMAKRGIYKRPGTNGASTVDDLERLLAEGYVFNDDGKLQLSKKLDTDWQATVVDMYHRVSEVIRQRHGFDVFVIYGSLLGQVREQGFIAHDNDFDVAYVSSKTDGREAAEELRDVGFSLIDAGFDVETRRTALHIHDERDHSIRIDLFHLYFNEDGRLEMPFGRAGDTELRQTDWSGTEEAPMGDHTVRIPRGAEKWVEHIYGANWRTPTPGFHWDRARVAYGREGRLPEDFREAGYWANFYARHGYDSASTFCEFIQGYGGLPEAVVDIGCGDGRDAFSFARDGRPTSGFDRSHVGIERATKKAADVGLDGNLTFDVVDVADSDRVAAAIAAARERAGGSSLLFYLRFFLHSIPADVQDALMTNIASAARPGDAFAAEFRTDKDEALDKVHGRHYRRFQSASAFAQSLAGEYGFDVEFELESQGLSPYKGEDPVLYRVVARRRA